MWLVMIVYDDILIRIIKYNLNYTKARGESMNNYTFDNEFNEKMVHTINSENKKSLKKFLEKELINICDLHNIFSKSEFDEKEYKNLKNVLQNNERDANLGEPNRIVITNKKAFDNSSYDEYLKFDNQIHESLEQLNFKKNYLLSLKQHFLNEFNISKTVKICNEISKLEIEINKINLNLKDLNKTIFEKENEFILKYNSLRKDIIFDNLLNNLNLDFLNKKYNKEVINYYIENKLFYLITTNLDMVPNKQILEVMGSSENIKDLIGDNYNNLIDRLNVCGNK